MMTDGRCEKCFTKIESSGGVCYACMNAPITSRIPHKCPVCDGTGKVSRPPWVAGDVSQWTDSGCSHYACNACSGSGIVWDEISLEKCTISYGW